MGQGHRRFDDMLPPKRIDILPQRDGDVVARHTELGNVVGEFYQTPGGEIYLRYAGDRRHWYVNKSITAFREAGIQPLKKCFTFNGRQICE